MFRLLSLGIAVADKGAFIFKCTCDSLPRVCGKLPSTSAIQRAVDSAAERPIQNSVLHAVGCSSLLIKRRQITFLYEVHLLWMFYTCVLT